MTGEESIVDILKKEEQLTINHITPGGGTQKVERKVIKVSEIAKESLIELIVAIVKKKKF